MSKKQGNKGLKRQLVFHDDTQSVHSSRKVRTLICKRGKCNSVGSKRCANNYCKSCCTQYSTIRCKTHNVQPFPDPEESEEEEEGSVYSVTSSENKATKKSGTNIVELTNKEIEGYCQLTDEERGFVKVLCSKAATIMIKAGRRKRHLVELTQKEWSKKLEAQERRTVEVTKEKDAAIAKVEGALAHAESHISKLEEDYDNLEKELKSLKAKDTTPQGKTWKSLYEKEKIQRIKQDKLITELQGQLKLLKSLIMVKPVEINREEKSTADIDNEPVNTDKERDPIYSPGELVEKAVTTPRNLSNDVVATAQESLNNGESISKK